MTAIGKILVLLLLAISLGLLTWATSLYAERPGWFSDVSMEEGVDKGNRPVNFKQLKGEIDSLGRSANLASEAWGTHLALLEASEKLRADRKAAYAERLRWAHKGNPRDPIDPGNPKSPGKGFYDPVIDPRTGLYELSKDANGIPKGKAVLGTNGAPLPGLDGLVDSISGDAAAIVALDKDILALRNEFQKISLQINATQDRALRMGVIRDSVQAELFFLLTFEVNVYETRATVIRREKQLRDRLKSLGVTEP